MKKLFLSIFILFVSISAFSQVMSGTYTIGFSGDDFNTLSQALDTLSKYGADGPVVLELAETYSPGSESYPIYVKPFAGSSASNSLTIKPATNTAFVLSNSADAIFYITADNVTIDGSNNGTDTKNLTISCLKEADNTSGVAIENTNNIIIKNCNIKAAGANLTSSGVYINSSYNIIISDNNISKAQVGVISTGDHITVENNNIGSENSYDYLDFGVSCQFGQNIRVLNNKIFNLIDNDCYNSSNAIHAVAVNDLTGFVEISGNYIDMLVHTGTNNVVQAIAISDCEPDSFIVANNRISNIASNAYTSMYPAAIAISAPNLTTIDIVNNSINIPEHNVYGLGGTDYIIGSAFIMDAGSGVTFKNNVVSNTLGSRTGNSNITIGVIFGLNTNANPFKEIDNNVYYLAGDFSGTQFAMDTPSNLFTFNTWQAYVSGDYNSTYNSNICFTSNDDLHLTNCSPAIARSSSVLNLTTDIEGITRDASQPTAGAYEYQLIQASNIVYSTIVNANVSWTSGNGYQTAVFMKQGDVLPEVPQPENNTTYNYNTTFGSGDQIGNSGWYCVFNGLYTGNDIEITAPNDTYTIMVCEYFGSAGNEIYLNRTATDNPATIVFPTSLDDVNNLVKIYPNPTSGVLNISDSDVKAIIITDLLGKEVKAFNSNINTIDISDLKNGVYIIKVIADKQILTSKIVLQK